jgi:hypothetical protein
MLNLLALSFTPADVRAAEAALVDASPTVRAGALELLDNLVHGPLRKPVLEALEAVILPRRGMAPAREATLAALLELDDASLRHDVLQAARREGLWGAPLDELAMQDFDPVV